MPTYHHPTSELRSPAQHNRLFGLLGRLDIDADGRHDLVKQFTNGRSTSTKDLFGSEANALIHHLEALRASGVDGKTYRQRRKVFSLAHELGWEHPNGAVDKEHLDAWCVKFGKAHKPLMELDVKQLAALISQMEIVLEKQDAHG